MALSVPLASAMSDIFERRPNDEDMASFGSMDNEFSEDFSFDDPLSSGPSGYAAENTQTDAQNSDQGPLDEEAESLPSDDERSLFGEDTSSQIEQAEDHSQVTPEASAENTNEEPQTEGLDQMPPNAAATNSSETSSSLGQPSPAQDAGDSTGEPDYPRDILDLDDEEWKEMMETTTPNDDPQQNANHAQAAGTRSPPPTIPNTQPPTEPGLPGGGYLTLLNGDSDPTETEQQYAATDDTILSMDANSQSQGAPGEFQGSWDPNQNPYFQSQNSSSGFEGNDLTCSNQASKWAGTVAQGTSAYPTEQAAPFAQIPQKQPKDTHDDPYPLKPLLDQARAQGIVLPTPDEAAQGSSAPGWGFPNMDMTQSFGAQQTAMPVAQFPVHQTQGTDPHAVFNGVRGTGLNPNLVNPQIHPAVIADYEAENPGMKVSQPLFTRNPVGMAPVTGTMPPPVNAAAPQVVPAATIGSYPAPMPAPGRGQMYTATMPAHPQPSQNPSPQYQPHYPSVVARGEPRPGNLPILRHQNKGVGVYPSLVYPPLEAAPPSWGPDFHRDLFSYTATGEWEPSLKLSKNDIRYYVDHFRKRQLPFKIWIQHYPAQRNYRHPNPATLKCRWDECPATNGTINKGFYRVVFDERPESSGVTTDPFHYAGSMHLHCFEKMFDIYELVVAKVANIDKRNFAQEDRNPMSVVEGHPQLAKVFYDWCYAEHYAYGKFGKEFSRQEPSQRKAEGRVVPRERKLWYVLTKGFVSGQTSSRDRMRDERNGNSIDRHLGDLDVFINANKKSADLGKRLRKRLKEEIDADESMVEEDAPRVKRARRSNPERRTRKRAVEEIDDRDLTSDEDVPRVKRPRRGSPPANPASPSGSHITVMDTDEEAPAPPAKRGKKRAAEEMDEKSTSYEDTPRVKRPRRSSPPVKADSPAGSITVAIDDEEAAAKGGPVRKMQE